MKFNKSIVKKMQKITLFGVFIFLIFIIPSYFVCFKILIDKKVDESLQVQGQYLKDYLNLKVKKSLSEVHLLAENFKVKEVYATLKKEVGDLSKVTERNKELFIKYGRMLREVVDPIIERIQKQTGDFLYIHFHLPGPCSFIRINKKPGEDIMLDDLSSFRFSVVQAQKEKKVVIGIEPGRDGIILRAIAPIVISGEVLGSVEAGESLNDLMQDYVKGKEDQIRYIILVKKNLEKIMDFNLKERKGKSLGDWIMVGKSNNLGEDIENEVLKNFQKETIGISSLYFRKMPIKSFSGEEIGYVVLGTDLSRFISLMMWLFLGLILFSFVLTILFFFIINSGVKGCLSNLILTARAIENLAKGKEDLNFRLDVRTEDEIGTLSKHFNAFMDSITTLINGIMEKTKAIFSESEKLKDETDTLNEKGVDFKERADYIYLSLSELLSAMEDIARSMQELSSAINEISKCALESSSIIRESVETINTAKVKIEYLQKASQEINEVINLINNFWEQANILALNASIEAARAGEAGKGFAVIANEVKELARQTQEMTSSIAEKIRLLQESSSEVSSGVESIVELIAKVEESTSVIASAVEDQTIVINSVSEHIMATKNKIMDNEDQANVIKNTAEEIVFIAERLKELSIRITNEAKAIEELNSQFKV
ncbi:MAG: methyl-accepting chemotaxis protein [Caldimicrobium sp.]